MQKKQTEVEAAQGYRVDWDVRQHEIFQLFQIKADAIKQHYHALQLRDFRDVWRYITILFEYWTMLRPMSKKRSDTSEGQDYDEEVDDIRKGYWTLMAGKEKNKTREMFDLLSRSEEFHKTLDLERFKLGLGVQFEEEAIIVEKTPYEAKTWDEPGQEDEGGEQG